jgi:4-hydroxybenzoate polyprenyltransferase
MQVLFALRFLSGAFLAGHAGHRWLTVIVGVVVWLLTVLSVYVFNGVMDRTEDAANGKRRPIATGELRVRTAMQVVVVSGVLGLVGSVLVGLLAPVIVFLVIGYVYSGPPWPAKRTGLTTTLVIGGMGLATFWAGATTGGGINRSVVVFGVVMAAWIGLVGAVLKDLADAPGDAVAGRRTFAVAHGIAPVRRYVAVAALTIGLGGLAASVLWARWVIPAMIILAGGAVWVAWRCRGSYPDGQEKLAGLRPYFASFWVQYATAVAAIGAGLLR